MPTHRVLVVEDDLEIRETVMEILEEHGYEPIGAENGLEALDKLRSPGPTPCLILLDLMMPRMDGRSFRQVQLQNPELASIPVVVITAFRDMSQALQEMKVADLLKKPFNLQDLLGLARRYCSASAEAC